MLYTAKDGRNSFEIMATNELQQLTRVIPIKKNHKISLTWVIPPGIKDYDKKYSEYVSFLLGHEGPGSLLSYLRKENLANSLSGGVSGSNFDENTFLSLFNVTIKLTKKGFVQWTKVVKLVFEYLAMLKSVGPQRWVFDEIKTMHDIEYRFMDEEESYDFVERLVVQMLPCLGRKDEDLLTAASLVKEFDHLAINTLLEKFLTPEKAKIHFSSCQFRPESEDEEDDNEEEDDDDEEDDDEDDDDEEDDEDDDESDEEDGKGSGDEEEGEEGEGAGEDRITSEEIDNWFQGPIEWKNFLEAPSNEADTEPHFGVRYYQDAIPASLYSYWESAYQDQLRSELHLPPPNHFIPYNISMIGEKSTVDHIHKRPCIESVDNKGMKGEPKLHRYGSHSLWHLVETKFGRPKVEIQFQLYCKLFYEDIKNVVAHELLIKLLREHVNEVVYMASMAELSCNFKVDNTTWRVQVSGFNDKAIFFAKLLFANLCSSQCITSDPERIKRQLQVLQDQYENEILKSDQIANHNRLAILFPAKFPTKDKLAFLKQEKEKLSRSDWLLQLHGRFCQHFHITSLVEGNLTVEEAKELMSFATQILKQAPVQSTVEQIGQLLLEQSSVGQDSLLASSSTDDESLWSSKKPNLLHMSDRNVIVMHDIPSSPQEKNACAEIYFQYGLYDIIDTTKLDLLENLLTEPFFDQMRTKQQVKFCFYYCFSKRI